MDKAVKMDMNCNKACPYASGLLTKLKGCVIIKNKSMILGE